MVEPEGSVTGFSSHDLGTHLGPRRDGRPNMMTPARPPRLTPREEEIVGAILSADSNKQIAEKLGISEQSVKNRLTKLYRKFNVGSRLQLMRLLMKSSAA